LDPAPSSSLRIALSGSEPPMQASKWLQHQVLVDADEMEALFQELGNFSIYHVSGLVKSGEEEISKPKFLDSYRQYVQDLKQGKMPSESAYRQIFSSVFTCSPDILYAIAVGENQYLVRISRPVIQLQAHRMDYSPLDGRFRSMVLGSESIVWGLQFSYPQIFENPLTHEVEQVRDTADFPNTQLFKKLQKWIRNNTVATPFLVDGKKINVPIRLGKHCFSWINCHPQLLAKDLKVQVST